MNLKFFYYFILFIFSMISWVFVYIKFFYDWPTNIENNKVEEYIWDSVCIKEICFKIDKAKTPQEKNRWLQYVDWMPDDYGMLMIYDFSNINKMWMKDTLIPLDIIWIDENKKISYIEHNAQPCEENKECKIINPKVESKYILEINWWLSSKHNFQTWDMVNINIE